MIIDFHTHAFPEKIAAKAMGRLAHAAGLFPHTDGTVGSLRELMRRDGVDTAVLLPIATNPSSQRHINDYAISCAGEGILPFGTVHPDASDVLEELEYLKEKGIKGLKFHPEYQQFFVNDEKMCPIYKKISQLGLITVFHAGPDYGFRPPYHCMPENLLGALRWLDSPVVAAHWGGADQAEDVLRLLKGIPQLYLDTAFGYGTNIRPYAHEIIETFGCNHILFASDAPWHPPVWEMRLLETLDLSENEQNAIYSGNAQELLKLN